jgi:hypothetical protein
MKIRTLTILALILSQFISYAQNDNFSTAILIDKTAIENPMLNKLYEASINNLMGNNLKNVLFYDWTPSTKTVQFSPKNKREEKPSDVVIYVSPKGEFEVNPILQITADTTGKTTAVFFPLKSFFYFNIKHLDVASSKVLKSKLELIIPFQRYNLNVADYLKEFGGDPTALRKSNPRKFSEVEKAITLKYQEKIESHYMNQATNSYTYKKLLAYILSGSQDYFEIVMEPTLADKKAKRIKFKGGANDNLVINDQYKVLTPKTVGSYTYYDDVATLAISAIGDSISEAKTLLFGSGDLADALRGSAPLLLVKESNTAAINKLNLKEDVPRVNIAIKKNCLFCLEELEAKIYECPVFNVVERNAPELRYFANLTKNDAFIDYSLEDLQGKKLGYEILLTLNNDYFQVIETKTNKNIASFEKSVKAIQLDDKPLGQIRSTNSKTKLVVDITLADLQRMLTAYNSDLYYIDWISTLEEKKNKIEKIAVHHPVGMDRYMEYNFYLLEEEEVDGEKIFRKNKIGRGRIGKSYSPNISELKIKDGEKEIYAAVQAKSKIIIEVSDKTKI